MLKRHSCALIALRFGVPDALSLDFTAFDSLFNNSYLRTIGQPMNRLLSYGPFAILTLVLLAGNAHAQDLEPRSYTNTPVGLNFLLGGTDIPKAK